MKRAQEKNFAQAGADSQKEVEMKDDVKIEESGINKNIEFSFVALYTLRNMHKNTTSSKKPVTLTKIQGNSNVLKRL